MAGKCYLRCLKNSHKPILLKDCAEFIAGRSSLLNILDPNCSRNQLTIKPDLKNKIALITRTGVNASGVNGFKLLKDEAVPVTDGAYIEMLLDEHVREIIFTDEDIDEGLKELPQSDRVVKRPRSPVASPESKTKRPAVLKVGEESNERNLQSTSADSFEEIDKDLLYVFTTKDVKSSRKIAAYDLDNTIIKTKSGKVFPKDIFDWQIAFPEVPGKLKQYLSDGYKIVFFTNQAGIGNKKLKVEDFRKKLENIFRRIGVPGQAFISSGKGIYRKPATGMWDTLVQMKNDNVEIDMMESFYCGDAAGRSKDHSHGDRLFAENLRLRFCTPESHFGGRKELPYSNPSFDPKKLDENASLPNLPVDKQEVVVLVGFPGSGKSYVSSKLEKQSKGRYKAVCRDLLGNWQKCVTEGTKLLKSGKSVIADSTNPDKESRSRWLTLAKENGIPCRCIEMDVSMPHALHNNKFRQLTDTTHSYVADVIFYTYKKKYEKPEIAEGFCDVLKIPFVADFTENSSHKDLYFKHLLEK